MTAPGKTNRCLDCDVPVFGLRCRPHHLMNRNATHAAVRGDHATALAIQRAARGFVGTPEVQTWAPVPELHDLDDTIEYLGGWRLVGGVYRPTEGRGAA